jgi:hypothetical protein
MVDRVSSDAVPTVRATLVKHGAMDRLRVELPEAEMDRFPAGDVVRVVLDGDTRHAEVKRHLTDDTYLLAGAFDTPEAARERSGEDRLEPWCEAANRQPGGSVLVDVVEEGFLYGLRAPGQKEFYTAVEAPEESLADIAESVDGGE